MINNIQGFHLCSKHNLQLDFIDLSLRHPNIYKCLTCIEETSRSRLSKLFNDQKQVEKFNSKDMIQIQEAIHLLKQAYLKQSIGKIEDIQDKQYKDEEKKQIFELIRQLKNYDQNIDIRMIKNIIFTSNFEKKLVQRFQFPVETNMTTNMIQFYNKYIIFGSDFGDLKVYSIAKNRIICQQRVSHLGLVVLITDPKRIDYFFASGYDGKIVECQLQRRIKCEQNKEIKTTSNILSNAQQMNILVPEEEEEEEEKQSEENLQEKNQSIKQKLASTNVIKDNDNYDEDNIQIKVRRKFINNKQICRMIFCNNGEFLAAGVGKKIALWNIKEGKIHKRLIGYHSSQVYGLENMNRDKHILSISKGTVNLFDISKAENPLIAFFKFQKNYLCTRIKKLNDNEFLVFIFPQRIAFFRIFQEKKYITEPYNPNVDVNANDITIKGQKQSFQQGIEEEEEDDINCQQKLFSDIKCLKNSQRLVKRKNLPLKNLKLSQISYNIIKIGGIEFAPKLAFNINMFDNYIFNVNGDYKFSFLINYQQFKSVNHQFNLENIININEDTPRLILLQYHEERVLTSILLENVQINNQFYKNVLVTLPRNNQFDEVQNFSPSLNMCLYA